MAFDEAVANGRTPQQLRVLLAIMAVDGAPIKALFDDNMDLLSADFENKLIDAIPPIRKPGEKNGVPATLARDYRYL